MKRTATNYLVFVGIFLMSALASAQQDPQFTHYMYNMNVINPAYATDNEGVINIGGLYRTQWDGFRAFADSKKGRDGPVIRQ